MLTVTVIYRPSGMLATILPMTRTMLAEMEAPKARLIKKKTIPMQTAITAMILTKRPISWEMRVSPDSAV